MYAVEFDTVSKDGFIYIPQEYKDELNNKENIRLVVMYDKSTIKEQSYTKINEIEELENLFSNSDNKIIATANNAINTDEMINDIS